MSTSCHFQRYREHSASPIVLPSLQPLRMIGMRAYCRSATPLTVAAFRMSYPRTYYTDAQASFIQMLTDAPM
jgi:hypothetical protein